MRNQVSELASVGRALRVIALLAERQHLSVSEIAMELDISVSSAYRLLSTLRAYRFAIQDSHRRYWAGPAFAEVLRPDHAHAALQRFVRPYIVDLARDLTETVHFAVLEGSNIRFLESVEAQRALRVTSRAGRSLPAHCTSGGKALLAQLSDAQVASMYPVGLPALPPPAITEMSKLFDELAKVRNCGYGVNVGESEDDITAIGTAIYTRSMGSVGSISVSLPTSRLTESKMRHIAEAVVETAQRTSASL